MNAKSNILVQLEILEAVRRLKEYTEMLLESYTIDDIVLGIVRNQPQELTEGFMSDSEEFSTLDESLKGFDPCKNCLRIFGGKYYRGLWTKDAVVSENCGKTLRISDFREI